jgi:heat shock protein HslJ
LNSVQGYTETGQGIALTDAEGNAVLTLEKRETPAFTLNDLSGEWVITSIYGAQVGDMENTPFLAFDINQMRVHGNAGCNTINGGFSQEEGKENSLKFSQMISTMMACPDMKTERMILDALNKISNFSLNEDQTISLNDSTGTVALTLVKYMGEPLTK